MQRKKTLKWTRSAPIKRPDTIISSDFSTYVPFKPQYECEEVSMFKLMAMDYAREWFKEKQKVKEVIVVSNEAAFLQRRYVLRGLLKKFQKQDKTEKRFIMKKFQNIPSKFKEDSEKKAHPPKEEATTYRADKEGVPPCKEGPEKLSEAHGVIDVHAVCDEFIKPDDTCPLDKKKLGQQETEQKPIKKESTVQVKLESPKIQEQKEENKLELKSEKRKSAETLTAKPKTASSHRSETGGEVCVCRCSCSCTAFRPEAKRQKLA